MEPNKNLPDHLEKMSILHTAYRTGRARLHQCLENVENDRNPKSIALIGESGTGKTKLLKSMVAEHPFSDTECLTSCPVLYLEIMPKPTTKKLFQEILMTMGDKFWYKGTEAELRYRCWTLLKKCGVKMILFDEYQRLIERSSKKVIHDVAELTKDFINSGIGVVVAGIRGSENILNADSQLKRRMMSTVFLNRFDYENKIDQKEFISILSAFYKYIKQHCALPEIFLPENAIKFYCASGGLIGYVTLILDTAMIKAIHSGTPITFEILHNAWVDNVNDHTVWGSVSPFSEEFKVYEHADFLVKAKKIGLEYRSLDFRV